MTFSSNADSLFLSWELTDDRIQFDSYRITDNKSQQVLTVGRDETSCLLTHVPYNEPVAVYLSLVAGGEVVKTAKTDVVIDGLDKTTAATLIPDRGSVTGGDGTYSIPLPDGRSIFLMGDSYIGPVTNGQRPTSDHMFRNTYILYDEGRVSAIYGAGGDGERLGGRTAGRIGREQEMVLARPRIRRGQHALRLPDGHVPGSRGHVGIPLRDDRHSGSTSCPR